jgi:uncharacterized membrane protein HdeD (DUF308 family)
VFFAIFGPAVKVEALTWIMGIWLIIRGVFEAVGAFIRPRLTPRWLILLSAALSILLGVFFVANPGRGVARPIALAWGIVFVAAGLGPPRARHAPHPASPTPP